MRKTHRVFSSILLLVLLPFAAVADTVRIPAGTTVYCVLDQDISTKKKLSSFVQEGDRVRALVMEDVLVDGHVVIEAGSVVWSKVSKAKRAKVAGIRGKLEVEATTVNAVDGSGVNLYGGYDRSGRGRIALAAAFVSSGCLASHLHQRKTGLPGSWGRLRCSHRHSDRHRGREHARRSGAPCR